MAVRVESGSAAVRRTLEQIVTLSGETVARAGESPSLLLRDSVHTANTATDDTIPTLALVTAEPTSEQELRCPIHPSRLIARLAARATTSAVSMSGGWALDVQARGLMLSGETRLNLTEKECQLLQLLVRAAPEAMSREALLGAVWGMDGSIDTHTLETHIYRIRGKLETLTPNPGTITTEGGTYRFRE